MTTINTTSISLFNEFLTYFQKKRLHLTTSHTLTGYSITLYNLTTSQTNHLLGNFTHHFHLINNPSSYALAA